MDSCTCFMHHCYGSQVSTEITVFLQVLLRKEQIRQGSDWPFFYYLFDVM